MPDIVNKNPVNDPGSKPVKTRSKFAPNYSLYQTPQFGLNTPFFAMAGVGDDEISMRLQADVDAFTLKAPTMTPVKASCDYFFLPLRCLLPNLAELIITNPLRGDDVDARDANAIIKGGVTAAYALYVNSSLRNGLDEMFQPLYMVSTPTDAASLSKYLTYCMRLFQVTSKMYSSQSLMKQLGYAFDEHLRFAKVDANNVPEFYDFDQIFAVFINYLTTMLDAQVGNERAITVDYVKITGVDNNPQPSYTTTTIQKVYGVGVSSYGYGSMADLVYDLFTGELLVNDVHATYATFADSSNNFISPWVDANNKKYYLSDAIWPENDINLLRLVAYQKASAEFYTVDTVDDLYSARLWEDNQRAAAVKVYNNSDKLLYTEVNGVFVPYDSCAGAYLDYLFNGRLATLCDAAAYASTLTNADLGTWIYFNNLFNYTRSLKYQDYFVGSRVRPLAVGDVTVPVQGGGVYVDVIDVTKKIQTQRFLNQVNRIGRKFKDYVKGILGATPMSDAHEPLFLGHVVDTIGAEETQNTAQAQYDNVGITSRYRNNSSRYAFTVHVPEPGVIIGIRTFDIPRVYSTVTDRENMHVDRYDMFNPFMQFVGDQPVYAEEIISGVSGNFGYQQRYAEYKQRVSIASGGFLGSLPGYAKILTRKYWFDPITNPASFNIGSDFIRSRVSDLDEFYTARLVDCPRNTFNFIIRNDMEVTAHRPMAFNPSIL